MKRETADEAESEMGGILLDFNTVVADYGTVISSTRKEHFIVFADWETREKIITLVSSGSIVDLFLSGLEILAEAGDKDGFMLIMDAANFWKNKRVEKKKKELGITTKIMHVGEPLRFIEQLLKSEIKSL